MAPTEGLRHIRLSAVSPDAPEQLAELAVLAEETFIEAYADKIEVEELVPYARDVFVAGLLEAVSAPGAAVLWVRGAEAVAYASVRLPSAEEPGETVHLDRIYVRAGHRRIGIGRLLLNEAIAFYEALGFAVRGEETFQLGRLRQRDLVMCRPL